MKSGALALCSFLLVGWGAGARAVQAAGPPQVLSRGDGRLVLTNQVAFAPARRTARRDFLASQPRPAGPSRPPYALLVNRLASRYGVDEKLVHAVIAVESSYDPEAVSHRGAVGLMQLMPRTAADMGVVRLRDPHDNILGGVRLLRHLLDRYKGNLSLVIAAYNAGIGAVDRHGGVPPYPETLRFVRKVLDRYGGGAVGPAGKNQDRIFTLVNAQGSLVFTQYPSRSMRARPTP